MSPVTSRTIEAAVERQMRNWEIARQQQPADDTPDPDPTKPFLTVSRRVGTGGTALAARIAEQIHWPVFDRELLQHMSGDDDMRRRIYESLDERDIGFVEESLRGFTLADFRRNDYVRRLNETVLALARKGPAIFLGRGADLILPRDVGLRVRFVALQAARVERYAREKDLSVVAAARDIERVEQQRERFIQTCFHIDPGRA
jgi:cytidylate kinase